MVWNFGLCFCVSVSVFIYVYVYVRVFNHTYIHVVFGFRLYGSGIQVCVFVCAYVCTHVCICVCVYKYIQFGICMYVRTRNKYVRMHVRSTHVYSCMYEGMFKCLNVCMYVCTYIQNADRVYVIIKCIMYV